MARDQKINLQFVKFLDARALFCFFIIKVFLFVSGLLTNDGKYEDFKHGKASSNSKASNSLIDQIRKVGLFILLGPGLATLSFLRLLLLICIVSSSR